jgi:hypothetical protein
MFRKFFYAAAGAFLLALSFHLGNTTATAQATGQFVSITMGPYNHLFAITADGQVYKSENYNQGVTWALIGTIIGAPVPAAQQSWGQVKSRYR